MHVHTNSYYASHLPTLPYSATNLSLTRFFLGVGICRIDSYKNPIGPARGLLLGHISSLWGSLLGSVRLITSGKHIKFSVFMEATQIQILLKIQARFLKMDFREAATAPHGWGATRSPIGPMGPMGRMGPWGPCLWVHMY